VNTTLPLILVALTAEHLREHLGRRLPGHCVRVDDLTLPDAHAVAEEIVATDRPGDVHVLAPGGPQHSLEITADRAVELRNRKRAPLLLLVPAGTSHAASSLDNSFEPIPLIDMLRKASSVLEKRLARGPAAGCVAEVKRVLGRTRRVEPWARFLAAVAGDPTISRVGRQLWQVGLVPDHREDGLERRLRHNAKAVAALVRPTRPTARVADRLVAAEVKEGPVREALRSFLEQQDAGALADAVGWTRRLGEEHAGELTFDRWPLTESQQAALADVEVTPFRRPNGTVDPQCKLLLGDGGRLYCEVSPDKPGTVVVKWTTRPMTVTSVASWRVEALPPADLRAVDTVPVAATKVKGDKRRATLRLDVTEDDLALGTLFVIRVRAQDADGNDLNLQDGRHASADSDQFEIDLRDHVVERNPRKAGAPSLSEAVLRTAVDIGGSLAEDAPGWDSAGQVFTVRVGGRRMVLVPVSRLVAALQDRMIQSRGEEVAFDAYSPLGEPIDPVDITRVDVHVPPALADRRRKVLAAFGQAAPRDRVETAEWTDDLRDQVRSYLQSYRRALETAADAKTRADLLAMDTLSIRVGTTSGDVRGLVLLPTHPLRLAWVAAHDRLLRDWATEVAAGTTKAKRAGVVDLAVVAQLTPANMPFIMVGWDGQALVYAEELTHGSALYLPPDVTEPQAAADALCAALDLTRANQNISAVARSLADRIESYRKAHPGAGALRMMAVNPGSGSVLRQAFRPVFLPSDGRTPDDHPLPTAAPRLEVIAYSDRLSYTDPVGDLRRLQMEISASEAERRPSHLAPPMGLAVRELVQLVDDREGHHLAVVQDLATGVVMDAPQSATSRTAAFNDLLTPSVSERADHADAAEWYLMPAVRARGSGRVESEIIDAHRTHQTAVANTLGLRSGTPALGIRLDAGGLGLLRAAHSRADWVATVDRGIGFELFEDPQGTGLGGGRYLLDYAPDFLEGLGRRLTITTAHEDEVLRIIGTAMHDLGLADDGGGASYVLGRLLVVSGRLALRLLGDTTLATEAVSLAALIAHLDRRNQLDGRIIVPVDAHPEIFGSHIRADDEPARRCDLLIVRVTQRSLRIECVEVKARREAALPQHLADRIVDQLENTERILHRQFFAYDPPRLDGALQRTRLAALLHHYAERSCRYGLIGADKLDETHRNIDRLEEQTDPPEITKRGYVVSPHGSAGFPARHRGVPIAVLDADSLGKAGFTTLSEARHGQRIESTDGSSIRNLRPSEAAPSEAGSVAGGSPHRPAASSVASDPVEAGAKSDPAANTASAFAHGQGTADSRDSALPDRVDSWRGHADRNTRGEPGNGERAGTAGVTVELGRNGAGTPVCWEVSTKGSPHAFVLGIPGQGKSVTTRRIVHEFAKQSLSSLIIDFHGDMAASPPIGAQVIDASAGLPFSPFELQANDARLVNQTAWEVAEIIAYVCGLGEIQRGHVYKGLREAYLGGAGADDAAVVPTLDQFADAVEKVEKGARGRNARDRIRPLTDFGLFSESPEETFTDTWRSGVVVDLSRLSLETVQLAASAFILRKVYREMFRWAQDGSMRLALVLDEAHRLAKDVTLPKLMKEGRKYGVSVIVASQGAADFHRDVLGNAGTKIVFRTNFPASKSVASFLRGRDGQDLSRQIEQLSVGCAYVSTPDHAQARQVYMSR
jgi:DNA phosphorothioation-dependent restriction protein DptH